MKAISLIAFPLPLEEIWKNLHSNGNWNTFISENLKYPKDIFTPPMKRLFRRDDKEV